MTEKPLLLLDVDGVLNPEPVSSGKRPEGYQTHRMRPGGWDHPRQKPLRVWLNPQHGVELLKLAEVYELVWCTTWEHEANEWIAPHLGLPELPVIEFGKSLARPDGRIHWKTARVIEYTAGRPFVWVDDETGSWDVAYIKRHSTGSARFSLMHVNTRIGLTTGDFIELGVWHAEWATWVKAQKMFNLP